MRYSFTLAEDALLLFDSLTNNGSLNWTLTGPSGVIDGRNFNNSDAYQRDDATPFFAAAGAYVLTVAGNGQATGDFAFKLSDIAAATPITLDTEIGSASCRGRVCRDV